MIVYLYPSYHHLGLSVVVTMVTGKDDCPQCTIAQMVATRKWSGHYGSGCPCKVWKKVLYIFSAAVNQPRIILVYFRLCVSPDLRSLHYVMAKQW